MARAAQFQNVDPSIRRMAIVLVEEFIVCVEAGLLKGGHFYILRDRFLGQNADRWVAQFGKECADMAARGVYGLTEDECLTREAKRTIQAREKLECLRDLRELDPGRDTALNRWFVRWLGMRLY